MTVFIIIWMLIGIISAVIARSRGLSGYGLWGILLGPIGLIRACAFPPSRIAGVQVMAARSLKHKPERLALPSERPRANQDLLPAPHTTPPQSQATVAPRSVHLTINIGDYGFSSSRTPRAPDKSASGLPDLIYGFAERGTVFPSPAPFVECKIYFGSYPNLSVEQKRYYLWWRSRLDAGEALETTDTYLYIAGYEAAIFEPTLVALVERWKVLWESYPNARSFRRACATWIEESRLLTAQAIYDDITRTLSAGALRFDAAIRAGIAPTVEDVIGLCDHEFYSATPRIPYHRLVRTYQALRTATGPDRILTAALAAGSEPLSRNADTPEFQSLATREHIRHYFTGLPRPQSWYSVAAVKRTAKQLLKEAKELWSVSTASGTSQATADASIGFAETKGTEHRVPIRRSSFIKSLPPPDGIDGLKYTLTVLGDDAVLLLMGLVLHLSDVKPYIEGQIAYSREGRQYFTAAAQTLGIDSGIGPYRRSFYYLTAGPRAPWTLEPPSALVEMKMNVARARFNRGLQRELLGSDPRGELQNWVCDRIAAARSKTRAEVVNAFEEATGVGASIRGTRPA